MTDIVQDLAGVLSEIDEGIRNIMSSEELYPLLSRAVGEIERLRKANLAMGGQFTEDEKNWDGWL
jgi:hypothetical protein